ncbi:uncharacterized protein [Argopecten irradians]|uniref:uncharacterized protein n=1 Tax=Argopecten irradians TaxID=31199 RepID=UPI0037102AC9
MCVDLGKKLAFAELVETALRPVLVSSSKKKLVMAELTVPWETRCKLAHERKRTKYAELADECGIKGWQAWIFPVEVGCQGFPSQSCWRMLGALGITGKSRKTTIKELGKEAERAFHWLWIHRGESS